MDRIKPQVLWRRWWLHSSNLLWEWHRRWTHFQSYLGILLCLLNYSSSSRGEVEDENQNGLWRQAYHWRRWSWEFPCRSQSCYKRVIARQRRWSWKIPCWILVERREQGRFPKLLPGVLDRKTLHVRRQCGGWRMREWRHCRRWKDWRKIMTKKENFRINESTIY